MSADLPVEIRQNLYLLASEFEQAWEVEKPAQFEPYLQRIEQSYRQLLLESLLGVDVELRKKNGQTPKASDYSPLGPAAVQFAQKLVAVADYHSTKSLPQKELAGGLTGSLFDSDRDSEILVEDFQILRQLGAGGMGIVYLARQISLNRLVALKVLGGRLNHPRDKARFQREAQAAAKLKHPNIASVYFVGQDDQLCFMAMEYIDGIPLREVINRLKSSDNHVGSINDVLHQETKAKKETKVERFDISESDSGGADTEFVVAGSAKCKPVATSSPELRKFLGSKEYVKWCCGVVRDAAHALEHAHDRGVIHRDLKPENMMIDSESHVYLIDFGLARFFDDHTLTQTGQLVGTPIYMSPEQVAGRLTLDHRTDVYSLGMVLYELLTLDFPITAPSREAVFRNILTKSLEPLSWRNKAVSDDLENVVHMATAKDVDDRYKAAHEFADDLQKVIESRPVLAPPYHFKLDLTAIKARRPNAVIWAMFCMFVMLFWAVSMGIMFFTVGIDRDIMELSNLEILSGIGTLSIGLILIYAIQLTLKGRKRGWWMSLIICLLPIGWFVGNLLYLLFSDKRSEFGTPMMGLVGSIWPAVTILALMQKSVREWIRFAEGVHAEHRLRKSL